MSERIPAGAFPEAARAERELSRKVLGAERRAFESRAKALVEMRKAVNEHDVALRSGGGSESALLRRIADSLDELLRRPF